MVTKRQEGLKEKNKKEKKKERKKRERIEEKKERKNILDYTNRRIKEKR